MLVDFNKLTDSERDEFVELAKHGEENEFYEALEKCFGKGAQ